MVTSLAYIHLRAGRWCSNSIRTVGSNRMLPRSPMMSLSDLDCFLCFLSIQMYVPCLGLKYLLSKFYIAFPDDKKKYEKHNDFNLVQHGDYVSITLLARTLRVSHSTFHSGQLTSPQHAQHKNSRLWSCQTRSPGPQTRSFYQSILSLVFFFGRNLNLISRSGKEGSS